MPIYCVTTKSKLTKTDVFRVRQGGIGASDACGVSAILPGPPEANQDPQTEEVTPSIPYTPDPEPADPNPPYVYVPDEGGGGAAPAGEPDPDPITVSGTTFSNLSGDYQAFSQPSNLIALRNSSSEWVIRDPSGTLSDVNLGSDNSGNGAYMANFMWDNREDAYLWLVGNTLSRRRKDGSTISSVELPSSVTDRSGTSYSVVWRAGHRSGENSPRLYVTGYNQNRNYTFILPVSSSPLSYDLSRGFFIHDVTNNVNETSFHNLYRSSRGWVFNPQSDTRQAKDFYYEVGMNKMQLIEPQVGTVNNWSHPTVDGDTLVVWNNASGQIEILDISGLKTDPTDTDFPLVRAITIAECAEAYYGEASNKYVQYLHGHLTNGRLVFSVTSDVSSTTMGILVYDFATDAVTLVEAGFTAGLAFAQSPRPSISADGKMVAWLDSSGVRVRPYSNPSIVDAGQGEQVFPRVLDRPAYFKWAAGDISTTAWEALRASLSTDTATGRPKPLVNNKYAETADGSRLYAYINHEVPRMNADGSLYTNIWEDSFNPHCMVRPYKPGATLDVGWLVARQLYQFDLEFTIDDNVGFSDDLAWAIIFQLWGPFGPWKTIPAADRPPNRLSPPFALELASDGSGGLELITRMRGTSQTNGLIPWEYQDSPTTPITTGKHRATVWWKADYSGVDSYCSVWLDGTVIFSRENVKLGTPFDYLSNPVSNVNESAGGLPTFGVYTSVLREFPGVEVTHSLHRAYKLDRLPSV